MLDAFGDFAAAASVFTSIEAAAARISLSFIPSLSAGVPCYFRGRSFQLQAMSS
jgi:hypothetical protein